MEPRWPIDISLESLLAFFLPQHVFRMLDPGTRGWIQEQKSSHRRDIFHGLGIVKAPDNTGVVTYRCNWLGHCTRPFILPVSQAEKVQ